MHLFILPFLQLHLKMTGLSVCPEVHSQRRERGTDGGHGVFQKSMHRPAFSQSP